MKADREYQSVFLPNLPWQQCFIPREYVDIRGYSLDLNYAGNPASEAVIRKFDNKKPQELSIIVKKFDTNNISTDNVLLILRELNMLRSMRHPNLVRVIDKYVIDDSEPPRTSHGPEQICSIYHITVYCGVPLTDFINLGQYDMNQAKHWTSQLLSALLYIHAFGICHRDLRPENMCINPTDMKLTLLGFKESRVLHDENNTQQRGNEFYRALEMRLTMKKTYNEKVDIWSMAVILCELLTGRVLFSGRNGQVVHDALDRMVEICGPVDDAVLNRMTLTADRDGMAARGAGKIRQEMREVLRGSVNAPRGIRPEDIDNEPELNDFLRTTLAYNPDARVSADKAMCHSFLYAGELPVERRVPMDAGEARRRALLEGILEEVRA